MTSWNTIKEAVRALKGQMSKNARNTAKYQEKKERGPVKAFFHITKNENVPAIEQQGLLTNHPNANINSANHPFREHGTDAGGVWVTTEPTAFPVYGTTIGGKDGNASARADALSTIKIEVPLPELAKMKAVQDPYGKNILRRGDDPRAIEEFGTWAGTTVPTTVFLNDVKPQWLKNIGYVEEARAAVPAISHWSIDPNLARWQPSIIKGLNKADKQALTGLTGADRKLIKQGIPQFINIEKSPALPVREQIFKNQPITNRMPKLPELLVPEDLAFAQSKLYDPKYVRDGAVEVLDPIDVKRYSMNFDFVPARQWTEDYRDYVKPGEDVTADHSRNFNAGAVSRGIGGSNMPSVKDRNFNWNKYKQAIAAGDTPNSAMLDAAPRVVLDWNNIVYTDGQYRPTITAITNFQEGAISRGVDELNARAMRTEQRVRRSNANRLRQVIKPFTESNANIVRNEYKMSMPDDEIRELTRLEIRNNKDNMPLSEAVRTWSRLENSDILKLRQRALDKIEGSWLYDYLTK